MTLQIIGTLILLTGCQASGGASGNPTHSCVVTPNDLVECSETSE